MDEAQYYPSQNPRELALQLANTQNESPEDTVVRAKAYLAFLMGEI